MDKAREEYQKFGTIYAKEKLMDNGYLQGFINHSSEEEAAAALQHGNPLYKARYSKFLNKPRNYPRLQRENQESTLHRFCGRSVHRDKWKEHLSRCSITEWDYQTPKPYDPTLALERFLKIDPRTE